MAAKKETVKRDQIANKIIKSPVQDWLPDEYVVYALYTIRDRALLAEDGLKPVQRRILWTMQEMNAGPSSPFIKAATIAGACMGKYHPHGDSSISNALAKMAQGFYLRVPLIDAYGSVGVVSGDTPSAPRYWEARLTKAAVELLKETKDGAVKMLPNFDGKHQEPQILPARWPNDIINGTQGIAVGYASMMPAHNPDEVMDTCIAMLHNPNMSTEEIMEIMPGPDFPTGGEVIGVDGIKEYYETGSGTFTIRGKYRLDHLPRGKVRITFYELPYQVSAESVREKIIQLQNPQEKTVKGKKTVVQPNEKFSKGISRVEDLTDRRNGMRLIIETAAGFNHTQILNELFKNTNLQISFSPNDTTLVGNNPRQLPMSQMIINFLNLRRDCVIARSQHRLQKIADKTHQLNALLAALLDIDKAIAILRGSRNSETAKKKLRKEFKLDDTQAEYILSMQLRRLTQADSLAIEKEKAALDSEASQINEILKDDKKLLKVIENELLETKKIISSPRRTTIRQLTSKELKDELREASQASRDLDKNLPCYITRFANGSLLRTSEAFTYAEVKRNLPLSPIIEEVKMNTKDEIVVVTSDGFGHRIPVAFIPADKAVSLKDMGIETSRSISLVGISKAVGMKSDVGLAIGTASGLVKVSKTDYPNRELFPVITLEDGDKIIDCRWIGKSVNGTYYSFVTRNGSILLFDAKTVRETGHKASGIRGIKLKDDSDSVISFNWVRNPKDESAVLITLSNKTLKRTPLSEVPPKGRGGMGVATQIFKSGEAFIKQAYSGNHAVATLTTGQHALLTLPMLMKRSQRGVDFTAAKQLYLGSTEVEVM